MSLVTQLEAILFVASKPLTTKKLCEATGDASELVVQALADLGQKYAGESSGIHLVHAGEEWQLVTNPSERTIAERFMKAEISGELTKPQLETLTVISYCGPITRPELEQIRGVNCSLILRNLLMRGLIKESDELTALVPTFTVTVDYLRSLGLSSVEELPRYAELHKHEFIVGALAGNQHIDAPQGQSRAGEISVETI
jgi:segregation and condensation protein B